RCTKLLSTGETWPTHFQILDSCRRSAEMSIPFSGVRTRCDGSFPRATSHIRLRLDREVQTNESMFFGSFGFRLDIRNNPEPERAGCPMCGRTCIWNSL